MQALQKRKNYETKVLQKIGIGVVYYGIIYTFQRSSDEDKNLLKSECPVGSHKKYKTPQRNITLEKKVTKAHLMPFDEEITFIDRIMQLL